MPPAEAPSEAVAGRLDAGGASSGATRVVPLVALFVARALAWARLLGGWLALGSLGAEHATALGFAGAPLVVWLLAIAGLLQAGARHRLTPPALALTLAAAGLAAAGALWVLANAGASPRGPLFALALGWAIATVAASRGVRLLRARARRAPGIALPSPVGAAVAGGVIAWWVAGDMLALRQSGGLLALALLAGCAALAVVVALAGRRVGLGTSGPPETGCRAGLFDCSLPLPSTAAWRDPTQRPLLAASLAMLPMMASLPAMAVWCGAQGLSAAATTAWHLAAMLLPAALARRWLALCRPATAAGVVTLLLVAGAAAAWTRPGLGGLMAMSLLHATAWSLAWGWPLARRQALGRQLASGPGGTAALASATAVAVLGFALDANGPAAAAWIHTGIAGLALATLAALWLEHGRRA